MYGSNQSDLLLRFNYILQRAFAKFEFMVYSPSVINGINWRLAGDLAVRAL